MYTTRKLRGEMCAKRRHITVDVDPAQAANYYYNIVHYIL